MNVHIQASLDTISDTFKVGKGNINSLSDMFGVIINILLGVTFGVAIVGMAYSFFQYIISRGDKDAVKKAATALTWSVVALLISFFVLILRELLYKIIGVDESYVETVPGF